MRALFINERGEPRVQHAVRGLRVGVREHSVQCAMIVGALITWRHPQQRRAKRDYAGVFRCLEVTVRDAAVLAVHCVCLPHVVYVLAATWRQHVLALGLNGVGSAVSNRILPF